MNRITNEQREALVRRTIADRDAILAGQPTLVERIRAAIAADRCDGESDYAAGVNAACANHMALIDSLLASAAPQPVAVEPMTAPCPEADARDGARYRYLRELAYRSALTTGEGVIELHFTWPQQDHWPVIDAAADMDRAVDEARAAASPSEGQKGEGERDA
jgi:hypothetical protein